MKVYEEIKKSGIIPVVVLDDDERAIDTARTLIGSGISVMEITFRTEAAAAAIKKAAEGCPEMTVGAGTVLTLEQCKLAVECGAKFIVCPGFSRDIVLWCMENGITVIPGCATPTDIMAANELGLKVLKFFPANIYGGLEAIKALGEPFKNIKFIPTGGVNNDNIGEYASCSQVFAVGGSWICPRKDIAEGNFDKIGRMCEEARMRYIGFSVAHVGINCGGTETNDSICSELETIFGFGKKCGNSSNFVSDSIEVMKSNYKGENGHIAIYTNRLDCAAAELERRGYELDMSTAKVKNGCVNTVYLKNEIGGFAFHLLQR